MSKYAREPLDLSGLHTISIHDRGGKVKVEDFAKPYTNIYTNTNTNRTATVRESVLFGSGRSGSGSLCNLAKTRNLLTLSRYPTTCCKIFDIPGAICARSPGSPSLLSPP